MRLDVTTDDVPERERFDRWNAAVFSALAVTVQPSPDAEEPFRGAFCARTSGPLWNYSFSADGFGATRQSREFAHRHWNSYWIYRESGPGAWFRIAGQELVTTTGDVVVADADALFETRADRYTHELWMVPKPLIDPHLPALTRQLVARLSGHGGVNALAESYLGALTRNWDDIPEAAMGQVTETLGRLIGIACGAAVAEHSDAVGAARLAQARRYIDRHLADPDLSPASAAAALQISVGALHLPFEPTGASFARTAAVRRRARRDPGRLRSRIGCRADREWRHRGNERRLRGRSQRLMPRIFFLVSCCCR
jgi:hypothetical protein